MHNPNQPPGLAPRHHRGRSSERGVALFVVIVFVMLSMLLALWASRTSLFNEMVVGNDADYQRAFEAAQALLQDAEMDIRSAEPDPATNKTLDNVDCSAGGDICRLGLPSFQIPGSKENERVTALIADLAANATTDGCHKGLCIKRAGVQDFWNDKTALKNISATDVGARYGQFTGAKISTSTEPANPVLADTSAWNRGGWYWIEVLPYIKPGTGTNRLIVDATASGGGGPDVFQANLDPNVIYRITAVAHGRKDSTMVVLQQTYAQQRRKD